MKFISDAGGFAHNAYPLSDFDDAYDNRGHIDRADDHIRAWQEKAAIFRKTHKAQKLDQPYGSVGRQHFDLFMPEGTPKGLFVFVHGGYWMRFDKSYWSNLAAGPLSHGWAVAMPSYRLAPEVSITDIVRDVSQAINMIAGQSDGPIILAGHSAGGHLVSRMICEDSQLAPEIRARLAHIISVSGVHDLRPLLQTSLNETLKLNIYEANTQSPALICPLSLSGLRFSCIAGSAERPEFIRQNALMANIWAGFGLHSRCWLGKGFHHFNIIDGLQDGTSALTLHILGIQYLS